ncbi:Ig-like domain-containing protein [Larkinella soli]|uniref:Ig-like domain-containing protein n=1 Tax=Larkinella soli TaxID=1770527 RepID=UPI000FFC16D6|nr:Ig-like domain-containing protein [Larkinella soli]
MPIIDSNADDTHTVTVVTQPQHGSLTAVVDNVTHRVCITYKPVAGFTGNDKAFVRVTDSGNLSSPNIEIPLFVNPGTCPTCLTMELKVLLEGPYNTATHKMNTTLNQRGLLPGQTPIGQFAVPTPAGQPYKTAPWNYTGTEALTTYDADIVDWVLVSLRTDAQTTTPVFRVAGLLHDDGRITFVNPCFTIPDGQYHVVIEHRNHMGVMSPTKVAIANNKIFYDFTVQDSYTISDPPSFGQIQIDGKWMMYGGDGKKDLFYDNFDVNFYDSKLWKDESGIFDQYRYGDFNLDADVNFNDSVLWKKNNGRYSKVPH